MRFARIWIPALALLLFAFGGIVSSLAGPIPAEIVVKAGDPVGSSTVASMGAPFTNSEGQLGFCGSLADDESFVWCSTGPVFLSNSVLPIIVSGGESTMGVDDSCGFIFSPAVDGKDALYTQYGVLVKKGDPNPLLPGRYTTFSSRPIMLPNGTCWWMGGSATTPTGTTTNRHCFMTDDPSDPSSIVLVFSGGDVIGGKTISPAASNFGFWVSDNGLHHIHILTMDAGTYNVYLDGGLVAKQGDPTGQGDNWKVFDGVSVNNAGNYVFMGGTDGPTDRAAFIAYNGAIKVREGDTIDGVTIPVGVTTRWASINNDNYVAFMWGASTDEYLFYGYGPYLAASNKVLHTGDSIDVDNDSIADYTVTDFNGGPTVGPNLDLATDGFIHVDVDLTPIGGGAAVQAILRLPVSSTASVDGRNSTRPRGIYLLASRPNPFNSGITVGYLLSDSAPVRLSVYDVLGRHVRTLVDGIEGPGVHMQLWDGASSDGSPMPAGTYFIRLESDGVSVAQKVIRIE